MVDPTTRDLISRLADELDRLHNRQPFFDINVDFLAFEAHAFLAAEPQGEGPTDEELESVARLAEIQSLKEQGGLTAKDANGVAAILQRQRLAGLRAVLARWGGQPCRCPSAGRRPMPDIRIPDWLPANSAEAYGCGWVARDAVVQADASVDAILSRQAVEPVPVPVHCLSDAAVLALIEPICLIVIEGSVAAAKRSADPKGPLQRILSDARQVILEWLPAHALPLPTSGEVKG